MPLYEYQCEDCGHRFELLQRVGEGAAGSSCPSCGSEQLAKQFSTFAAGSAPSSASGAGSPGGCCRGTPT